MRRELSTGKETELLRRNTGYVSFYGLQASPDGSQLSLLERIGTNPRTIVLIPSGGGKLRELHSDHDTHPRPTTNVLFPFRSWTPDGRHLISATRDGTVWAYPTNGSEPRKLDWPLPEVGSLSPDGRQTAFAVRKTVRELRTIDNLLSALPR
jgi:hypothetical protein